jgi:hypothetical protein
MAKKPKKKEPDYKAIHRVADKKVPIFSAIFMDVFAKFANDISAADIEALANLGAFDAIEFGIPWEELRALMLESYDPEIFRTIIDAGDKTNRIMTRTIQDAVGLKVDLAFDSSSPRIGRYLESEVGSMITQMSRESQGTIRQMVKRAQLDETKASRLSRDIKANIGLRTDQENALNKFEKGLQKNSALKASQKTKMVNDYRSRLLGQRARMIARTESLAAANFGFEEGFNQAADEGLIDRARTTKEWIVTPDDITCPTCKPMNGVRVFLNAQWKVAIITESKKRGKTTKGFKYVRIPTRIHPHCRCAMKIHPVKNLGSL